MTDSDRRKRPPALGLQDDRSCEWQEVLVLNAGQSISSDNAIDLSLCLLADFRVMQHGKDEDSERNVGQLSHRVSALYFQSHQPTHISTCSQEISSSKGYLSLVQAISLASIRF